jgi:hypothetical protein
VSHIEETTGFLCRWALLALAAAAAAAPAAAIVAAVAAERPPRLIVADAAARQPRAPALAGRAAPPLPPGYPPVAMTTLGNGPLTAARSDGARVVPRLAGLAPGQNDVRLLGVPYGRYAFERREAVALVVPRGRGIVLVDAAVLRPAGTPAYPELCRCLDEIRRHAEVAFIHAGEAEEYPRVRRRLRRDFPAAVVLWAGGGGEASGLARVVGALSGRRQGNGAGLVTTRAALAREAAALGCEVHFVGPALGAPPVEGVRRHASFTALRAYLSGRPTGG